MRLPRQLANDGKALVVVDIAQAELAKNPDGRPRRIAAGPYSQSTFYAASGRYDITHTCNTWTAEALRVAGLPVSAAGVIFADQVTGQLAPFATPSTR